MRRNSFGGWLKTGLFVTGGVLAHRVVTGLLRDLVFKPALTTVAPEAAATDANGQPTSGLGQVNAYSGLLVGAGVAIVGVLGANKLIKNTEDRRLVAGGIVASFLHSVVVSVMDMMGQPQAATMLAGVEDGTAASISAMYGLGAGTSIQPEYRAIRGMGEYFRSPLGEYFAPKPMNGLGEYFESGLGALKPYEAAAGMGNYASNPDLYQAAAGVGAMENNQTNHLDPSSDLDRELTIAEAAAGIGTMPYQAAAGLGNPAAIQTVPRSSTWVPGMSDPSIWAGVKSINEPQAQHEMLTAGILQTDGGQGVFG